MRYHNITKDDMLNGDGLRVVLWVSGCEHACPGCHNQITWDENCGLVFDENAENEIFEQLNHNYISGITFSGGDPLYKANVKCVQSLAQEIKKRFPQKSIWVYTGYGYEEVKDLPIMKYVDVLVDGKFVLALKNTKLKWRGSSNQRVIDVQKSLKEGRVVLHCE